MTTSAIARRGTTHVASTAVVALEQTAGAPPLLFAGEAVDAAGLPVDDAVVTMWRIALSAEQAGRFELLAYGVSEGPIGVTVTAQGYEPFAAELAVDANGARLSDGTRVLLHSFELGTGDTR